MMLALSLVVVESKEVEVCVPSWTIFSKLAEVVLYLILMEE
jgi:hypothetical protein